MKQRFEAMVRTSLEVTYLVNNDKTKKQPIRIHGYKGIKQLKLKIQNCARKN
jgi:hypothetical protein